jgi:SAM-dependent methyltransferase
VTEPDFLHTTRTSYDRLAADYAERFEGELGRKPLDRAMFAAFAELVRGAGTVADVGCGPGQAAAHLHELGLPVFGIDLSPQMVAVARRAHPDLRFDVGSMTALELPDASLAGVVAYYSIINVPSDALPTVFAEFHRVLVPGGHVLVAFQVGDETVHGTEWLGHPISLDLHRRRPDQVTSLMHGAGLQVHAELVRQPDGDGVENRPRAYLLARRPAA